MTTELQTKMIRKIALNEFQPNLNGAMPSEFSQLDWVWADEVIENAADKGTFTSLINAGLAEHDGNEGRDACVRLTQSGYAAFVSSRHAA